MVEVTIPMNYRLGRQKLGNTKKQLDMPMQKNNPKKGNGKAATWEESSVGGGVCLCHEEGQKGFLICREKPARKKIALE